MKSRHPSLDWIRKVLAEGEGVMGDLQAPLVPRETPEKSEPAKAAPEHVDATPPLPVIPVLRLVK